MRNAKVCNDSSESTTKIVDRKIDDHINENYETFEKGELENRHKNVLSPYRQRFRFIVLVLCCMFMFGGYFCMDSPNALSTYIENSMTGESSFKYNMLYAMYSYPNIILPFFTGVFIDKIGLSTALHILFALCIIGQGFFTIGGYTEDGTGLIIALLGRTLFGIGNESLGIIQGIFVSAGSEVLRII
eukprot:CAMPEP_0168328182 /NCGR_PEP_ID=MMETSP0213-20121227/6335_1 /TAXON_ID=151035 /ORGANISM="Euplotes harpa, Strain FSP1.4" /LENGTH=186 /DNA_ID=CAMNT_0008331217 /DNA_START=70 /DNA_END=630 /DNA_ORIENTATION=+